MPALTNCELEKRYFEMFREHCILPHGNIEYCDKPDVIIRGERTIGIEITNCFIKDGSSPDSEQVQNRARRAVVDLACSLYRTKKSTNAQFSFGFDPARPIGNKREVAEKITARLLSLEPKKAGQLRKDIYKDLYRDIPELSFVYYIGSKSKNAKWQINQGYSTPLMSLEQLRKIIKVKEEKSKSYQYCDAYWLLVVIDFMDRAQDQEIQVDNADDLSSDVFEKIIVFKTHLASIVQINSC